jgi:acyl-CoA thioesterase-1
LILEGNTGAGANPIPMPLRIAENSLVLFQGDSITDGGRKREVATDLGWGYPLLIASWIAAMYPERQIRFLNRGISGNRVRDLLARWEADCIALKPDWVSILIGINDTWRRYDSNDPTSVQEFERDYRALLRLTRERTEAQIILMEPFVLHTPPDRETWREDLDPKIQVVRQLAREFKATLVPLDRRFREVAMRRDPAFWAADGVHPTMAGHMLIAQEWLKAVGVRFG